MTLGKKQAKILGVLIKFLNIKVLLQLQVTTPTGAEPVIGAVVQAGQTSHPHECGRQRIQIGLVRSMYLKRLIHIQHKCLTLTAPREVIRQQLIEMAMNH